MTFRCCRYLAIITVQPTDGSVNMLFDSCVVVVLIILHWANLMKSLE